jgi:hypothetical protein
LGGRQRDTPEPDKVRFFASAPRDERSAARAVSTHESPRRAAYVAGYRTERELSKEHEALIPAFIMLRGFTYLGWLMTRAGAMPNADRVADEVSKALSGFIPELLAEFTPLQRLAVNVLAAVKSIRD